MSRFILRWSCVLLLGGCTPSAIAIPRPAPAPEVFVLGSLHGFMLEHPHYSLATFADAIEQFSPDLILTEVRPEHPGPAEGSIDGGIEQSLVYAVADIRRIPVVEVDWFDDALVAELEREGASNDTDTELEALTTAYSVKIKTGTFEELQGRETTNLVRAIYDREARQGHRASQRRNETICTNVSRALRSRGRRVMVVFGLDHKYFLDDCVAAAGARAVPLTEWWTSRPAPPLRPEIKRASLENIDRSSALLRRRLADGTYGEGMRKRLEPKAASFDRWRRAIAKL